MGLGVIRTGTSVSFVEDKKDGKQVLNYVRDIRGALVWPAAPIPGYCLIMAQRNFMEKGKCPLVLLSEICEPKPTHFFKRVFDAARRFSCRQFYAETWKAQYEGVVSTFNDYASHHSAVTIWLEEAPSQNLEFGLSLIEEWTEAGAVEVQQGTKLAAQLEQAGQEDLGNEQTLFAVKALSFLIGSVEQNPWTPPNLFPARGRSRLTGII